jgi:phosphomevalonate kinase
VDVDSSAFFAFGHSGRKIGYGSSAAAVVAVVAALVAGAGLDPVAERAELWRAALEAHRALQGGRGSGYDVSASVHGGQGLFGGGSVPSWTSLSLRWLGVLHVYRGERSVATAGAAGRYQAWKRRDPAEARAYLGENNRLVGLLLQAPGWEAARGVLAELSRLAVDLGDRIGVPARMPPPAALEGSGAFCKAVGAGDELGVALGVSEAERARAAWLERLEIAPEGLRWE